MMRYILLKYKIFFSLSFLLIISTLLLIYRISSNTYIQPNDTASNENEFSPLQQSVINKTTQQEIEKLDSIEKKETLPDGRIRYNLVSPLISRKNEILVKNNVAIFERILVPEKRSATGYAKISDFTNKFGKPEELLRGSRFYGSRIATLIYAKYGFAIIGNTFTDEAYEIHIYAPTTSDSYKKLYGNDIQVDPTIPL